MQSSHIPYDYVPIILQFIVAMGFVIVVLIATHLLGAKRNSARKDASFECGLESVGNARNPFSIRYFMTAILFVLFDVEIIFMYPWAVNFRELGLFGFAEMLIFSVLLLVGLVYIILKGAFKWE